MIVSMTRIANIVAIAILSIACATPALAHPGHGVFSFSSGVLHPLLGLDHLLAAFAVGVLACRLGGLAVLLLPATFLSMMVVGAVVAHSGLAFGGAEFLIAASVVLLGVAIAFDGCVPAATAAVAIGAFAFAHGQSHGAEIPASATLAMYVAGFVFATGVLYALGLGLARKLARRVDIVRTIGALIAVSGAVIGAA
jgi:urease accessory protein